MTVMTTYTIQDLKDHAEKKLGECKSKTYIVMKTKYDWVCELGHPFTKSWDSVKSKKTWCPTCSKKEQGLKRRKYSIKHLQDLAASRGGKCNSTEYNGTNYDYEWECEKEHTWTANFETIKNHWCGKCANSVKKTIEEVHELAKKMNGKCLATEYENAHATMIWQCHQGHSFPSSYDRVNQGHWCPDCYEEIRGDLRRKNTIEDAQNLALKHNGKCLSTVYKNPTIKMYWECKKGHPFTMSYGKVREGIWCPPCSYEKTSERMRKYTIGDMHKIAEQNGGKCLSDTYKSNSFVLKWKCSNGHTFHKAYNHISRGQWCPKCSGNLNESKCRFILETFFDLTFEKRRDVLGQNLELDGYNPVLKVAFEYQGEQHYEFNRRYHKTKQDFLNQVKRDKEKTKLCMQHGIHLIPVPYWMVTDEEKIEFIADYLESFEIYPFHSNAHVQSQMKHFYKSNNKLKELREIAEKRGGELLSDMYVSSTFKLKFSCKEGHKFDKKPIEVNKGQWCIKCGYVSMAEKITTHTIEEMKTIAEGYGGECLSEVYVRSSENLKWKCAKGHTFEKNQENIVAGQWCPTCSKEKKQIQTRLKGLNKCLELAKERGGTLVSTDYKFSTNKLEWLCKEGHPFKYSRTEVQQGKWCRTCKS